MRICTLVVLVMTVSTMALAENFNFVADFALF
jgi:hypothetical protein